MKNVVIEMDEESAFWFEVLDQGERFAETEMCRMRLDAHAVERMDIEISQTVFGFVRHHFQIRRVCKIVEAIRDDRKLAVDHLERRHLNVAPDAEGRVVRHEMRDQLWQSATDV